MFIPFTSTLLFNGNRFKLDPPPEKCHVAERAKVESLPRDKVFYSIPSEVDEYLYADYCLTFRNDFVRHIESARKEEEFNIKLEKMKEKVQQKILEGDVEYFKKKQMKRHKYNEEICKFEKSNDQICNIESCLETALPGSCYCACHIMNDPDQKLFTQCSNCGSIYPIYGKCYRCS